MAIEAFNPAGLPASDIYTQVAVSTGARTVHVAGQVARTGEGEPVGTGDLAAQTEQAFVNVGTALASAGATFADVARLRIYVVDWEPAKMAQLGEGFQRAAARDAVGDPRPITLIGVAALAEPDLLIEVEATAVLD